jgi:hypothetical protein
MDYIQADRLKIIKAILEIWDALGIGISYGDYTPRSNLVPGNNTEDRLSYYW